MAILVLTSASGSPGVTTMAVGLALAWPGPVLLADCDPGAHQAVLAGYLAGRSAGGKGLLRVAEAHRDRRPLAEVIMDQTLSLTGEAEPSRLLLPGFGKPGSASLFGGVWPDLVGAFDRLQDAGLDVVVDAGRLGGHGLPDALAEAAAATCLVLRSDLRAVTSARIHLPTLLEQHPTGGADGSPALIVVGPGRPYGATEIGRALGRPVQAIVADDAVAAAHLSDGRPRPHRFDRSAFARSMHAAAATLSATLRRSAERVRI